MTKQVKKQGSLGHWTFALLASTAIVAPAYAQSAAPADTGGIEEVVVTAQKREENLQNVPVSVQVLGTERLDELHVTSFNDYAKFLPSLSYTTIGPGFARMNFRGVSAADNGNHSASLPTVGLYLDEQPVTTITGPLDIHVYDIARVEALAGPQGTLFGASSEAGTVRIITNQPSTAGFEGALDLEANTIEHGDKGGSIEGFVNIPLSDRAAVRLVGWYERDGGYIDNVPTSYTFTNPIAGATVGTINNASVVEDNYNSIDTTGFRAALKVDLNEHWTVEPTLMAQDERADGFFATDPARGRLAVGHFFPETSNDRWYQAALTVRGQLANLDVLYTTAYLNRIVDTQSDYQDYGIYYIDQNKTDYAAYFYGNGGPSDFTNPGQQIIAKDAYQKISHEFRISSPAENRLRFIAGVFYQRQQHDIRQRYIAPGIADTSEFPGLTDEVWLTAQQRVDRDYAIFGEVSYDLMPDLTLTAGIRGFRANNSLEGFFGFNAGFQAVSGASTGVSQCFGPATTPLAPCDNLDKHIVETGETHRLNLEYRLDPQKMVYATYSTGFRPGGINRRGTLPPYDSDTLTNYEIGWKTTWMNNRLRWNGAAFWEDWTDFQYGVTGQNGLTEIHNVGGATIKGIESDIIWRATDALTFTGAATLLHGETTSPICDFVGGVPDCVNLVTSPSGTELPITPPFKANLTARYEFNVGDWDAFAQGALVYQTKTWGDLRLAQRASIGRIPSSTLLNLSAGASHDHVNFSIYLNNATDEFASVTRFFNTDLTSQHVYDVPSQPRTLGVRIGRTF